tara:strand:- start:1028 stop:1348 length:321 start_codon:yes stop_codon:yes gene_type:complete
MSYHKQYYKDHPELKEKQRKRYSSMTQEQKKEFLDKQKSKRANETKEQREARLYAQRKRYQKNREARLTYQKIYNKKKIEKIETLEQEVKVLKECVKKYEATNETT